MSFSVFKLTSLICAFWLLSFYSHASICDIKSIDSYSFKIEMPDGRQIGIYGWQHPSTSMQRNLFQFFKTRGQSCQTLNRNLDQILQEHPKVLRHGLRVYKNLRSQNSYQVIATERSEAEEKQVNQIYKNILVQAQAYKKRCPKLKNKINQGLIVFPGPEAVYSYGSLQKDLLAPESAQLLKRAAQNFPAWAAQNDHLYNALSQKTKNLLNQSNSLGFKYTPSYKRRVLNSESDPTLKRYLKEYSDYNEFIFSQVPQRNTYMLKNILAQNKSTALVVGHHHVKNFKKQLRRICRLQMKSKSLNQRSQGVY